MELMLIDADVHRGEINDFARRFADEDVKKVYRAAAKTMLAKHRKGEHDQKEHGNWAKQVQSFMGEALNGKQAEQLSMFGPGTPINQKEGERKILGSLAGLPERISSATERVAEGMREFLSGSTWGERLLNGAAFLSRGTNAISEAAKVLTTYGPIAGARMIAAYFRYGGYDVPLNEPGKAGGPPKPSAGTSDDGNREKARNWALNRLGKNLPDDETLVLSQGKAPSEGFLIGKDGTVLAHAVGRGNDHYLPFGLRHLRMLRKDKGGEMVRRRALGGVTAEDIHAAMMLGADKVTVLSNSGTFTMDLTDRAKGLKSEHPQILSRFNDLLRREGRGQGGDTWNFTTYNKAMKALALEFPLHFDTKDNKSGKNPVRGDMNHPKRTLVDEFRSMFGVEVRNSPGEPRRWGDDNVTSSGSRVSTPWGSQRITYNEWASRERAAGRGSKVRDWEERMGWVESKTEPDNTRNPANRLPPPQNWNPTKPTVIARDASVITGGMPSEVRVSQMSQERWEEEQRRAKRVFERNVRERDEVRQRTSGSRLMDDIGSSSSRDPSYDFLESSGVEPDGGYDKKDRGYMLDALDYADDYDAYPED
jgi:hypothetical protein